LVLLLAARTNMFRCPDLANGLVFMLRTTFVGLLLISALYVMPWQHSVQAANPEQTIHSSHEVLQQFQQLQIPQIPESLLADVHGVAIIPDVIKLGFVVGGQRGHGVVIIRQPDGSWRAPLFVTITGGSIGWQVGAQATDFVLVFKTPKSVEGLLRGKFTLGADAAIAAGPVGRRAGAATDTELRAEIYSYSRSRGLFAGVSLEGSALQVDDAANASYYGPASPVSGQPAIPPSALRLVEIIAGLSGRATIPVVPAAAQASIDQVPTPALFPPNSNSSTQAELARAAATLSSLLDDSWRRHLALPAEIFEPGRQPSRAALEAPLQRYNAVARTPQYQALASRSEFQSAHRLLQAFYAELPPIASPQLALPPPPQATR
jgi:SH3 domain-containing YSC84-like protein 1